MIGGLLFRYWEGGSPAVPEHPNVRIEWLRKSRAQTERERQAPAPTPAHQPSPREEFAEAVPLPTWAEQAKAIAVTNQATARATVLHRTARETATAVASTTAAHIASTWRADMDSAVVWCGSHPAEVVPVDDAMSQKAKAIREHNQAALAAILAAL